MSMRDRARAIREHGAAERGNYAPKKDSLQLRMYNYWLRDQENPPKVENFCHYWRVVLIWAPLLAAFNFLDKYVFNKIGFAVIAALVLAAGVMAGGQIVLEVAGTAIALSYLIFGLVVGLIAASTEDDGADSFRESEGDKYMWMFPHSWLVYWPFVGVERGWKNLSYATQQTIKHYGLRAFVALLALASVAAFIFFAFTETTGTIIFTGIVLALAGFIFVVSFLSDRAKLRDSERAQARAAERLRKQEEHTAWLTKQLQDPNFDFDAYLKETYGPKEPKAKAAPKEPGKFTKALTTVGDFINLVFQAVRVKKWKICPIVQIPTEN